MKKNVQDDEPNTITSRHNVAIIGAGPIGLELAVCLKRAKVDYIHFDAHQIGYTMSWWPRNTQFFSTTERLAIAGVPIQNNHQQRITGEDYLAYLRSIVEEFDLSINTYERITSLESTPEGFIFQSQQLSQKTCSYLVKHVVLAIGDMEYPNNLHIPGEDLPNVSHYFSDPHDYFRKRVLIVGGKNSAVESALRCWRAGVKVTLSYRRASFDQRLVKHWLLPDMLAQIEAGSIQFLPETIPVEITPSHVVLMHCQNGKPIKEEPSIIHETDFVLMCTGFHGDQSLLTMAGVTLQGTNRVPIFNPETMETNVPNLYLAGTVAAGIQQCYSLFIENSHEHVGKIVKALTGSWPKKLGTVPQRNYHLPFEVIEAN